MKTIYRIYPAIGVARIGNSDTEYFLGPESPGVVPEGPYRDQAIPGKIKPQAVRFRIYEFERDDSGNENLIREVVVAPHRLTGKCIWSIAKLLGALFRLEARLHHPAMLDMIAQA